MAPSDFQSKALIIIKNKSTINFLILIKTKFEIKL